MQRCWSRAVAASPLQWAPFQECKQKNRCPTGCKEPNGFGGVGKTPTLTYGSQMPVQLHRSHCSPAKHTEEAWEREETEVQRAYDASWFRLLYSISLFYSRKHGARNSCISQSVSWKNCTEEGWAVLWRHQLHQNNAEQPLCEISPVVSARKSRPAGWKSSSRRGGFRNHQPRS